MPAPLPLLVVDAPSILYRAFFALPKSIRGADGQPVNALLGTANLVLAAIEQHPPRATVLCFGAEAATYRTSLYDGYHADRPPMPDELTPQWEAAPALFAAFGWSSLHAGELEADDLLGTLADLERRAGGRAVLFTGDRDMYQCVDDDVLVLFPAKGGAETLRPDDVRARAGVDPAQIPDLIALRGDPSDGIPGAKGIGAKGAAELLGRFTDLEGVLAAAHRAPLPSELTPRRAAVLREQEEQLRAYRDMATLRTVPGVERPADTPLDRVGAAAAARAHGMARLAARLDALGGAAATA
jgi:DNA polymerase-1